MFSNKLYHAHSCCAQNNKVTNELSTLDAVLHKLDVVYVVAQTARISQREYVHYASRTSDSRRCATALYVPFDYDAMKLLKAQSILLPVQAKVNAAIRMMASH